MLAATEGAMGDQIKGVISAMRDTGGSLSASLEKAHFRPIHCAATRGAKAGVRGEVLPAQAKPHWPPMSRNVARGRL